MKDKTILITGSGSGIGRTVAVTLSQYGAQLVLLEVKIRENLKAFTKKLSNKGSKEPLIHPMDFEYAEENEYQQIKVAIQDRFERLDGLINNAGILGEKKSLEQYNYSVWKKVMTVNLESPFFLPKLYYLC